MDKKTQIIAVAGKGGVGKTSLAGVIVKLLVEAHPDKKILAIDADPAVGLSTVLNVEVDKTIDDIRKEVIKNVEGGDTKTAVELLGEAKYEIMDAVVEQDGYAFIAIGRPETAGCYCKINSYLKEVITMLSDKFDYVVIDGEAGIEQINRRVMEKVTHLLLVTDASKKGCQVVQTIKKVADELVMYDRIGVIDCGDDPHVLINPVIIETAGEQRGYEGCLSVPGKTGVVTRPDYAKVKAYDEDMNEFILEGEGLLARAICHECEHLDGHMYVEKVEGELEDVAPYDEEE